MFELKEFDEIAALHGNPPFLPSPQIRQSLYTIVAIALLITVLHLAILKTYQIRYSHSKGYNNEKAWEVSYHFTSLMVNFFLGVLGLYHYTRTIPHPASGATRVVGWEEMGILGCIQMGCQLWALPVGYFFVNETAAMLGHHVQVMVVGALATFFTNGFRYSTPFFFGLVEVSSVPLSIMNHFKANPDLIASYPGLYLAIRMVFMVAFIYIRVFMWVPNMYGFLHDCGILCFTCDNNLCRAGLGASCLAGVGLTGLQLMWASMILRGFLKILAGGKKNKRQKTA